MSPLPNPADRTFIEELNNLSPLDIPNALALRRYEARARELLKTDAGLAYELLGALAALRGNIPEMRSYHEKALPLAPERAIAHANYSVSLSRAGYLSEACEHAMRAHELDRGNEGFRLAYIRDLACAGFVERAAAVLQDRQSNDPSDEADELARLLTSAIELLRRRKINDRDTSALVRVALEAVHKSGRFFITTGLQLLADEDADLVILQIGLDAPPTELAQIIDDFAGLAVDSDVAPATTSVFCIRFSQLERTNAHHAEAVA